MSYQGDVIENPISGERVVFLETGVQTHGSRLRLELFVEPDGAIGPAHIHPRQDERFIVKSGQMTLVVNGRERVVKAGEEAIVVAGSTHEWWNSGEVELNAEVEFRPAGRIEGFVTSYFGLAKAGQTNSLGVPGVLQSAVMLHEYRATIQLAEMRSFVRRFVLPVLSIVGRSLGLRADYPYPIPDLRPPRWVERSSRSRSTAGEDVGLLVGHGQP
jgi:quercetin dioxygenase-like cupin family protein